MSFYNIAVGVPSPISFNFSLQWVGHCWTNTTLMWCLRWRRRDASMAALLRMQGTKWEMLWVCVYIVWCCVTTVKGTACSLVDITVIVMSLHHHLFSAPDLQIFVTGVTVIIAVTSVITLSVLQLSLAQLLWPCWRGQVNNVNSVPPLGTDAPAGADQALHQRPEEEVSHITCVCGEGGAVCINVSWTI